MSIRIALVVRRRRRQQARSLLTSAVLRTQSLSTSAVHHYQQNCVAYNMFSRRLRDYFDKDIIPQNSSPMLQLLSNHHTPEAKMKCFENSYFFATTHDLFTVKGFREVIIEGQISANANSFYCYVCVRIYTI